MWKINICDILYTPDLKNGIICRGCCQKHILSSRKQVQKDIKFQLCTVKSQMQNVKKKLKNYNIFYDDDLLSEEHKVKIKIYVQNFKFSHKNCLGSGSGFS